MTYNFELDIRTNIKAENVEAMIKNIVQTQTGRTVETITVRYEGTTFDGYDIQFQQEVAAIHTVKKDSILDRKFKPFKWDQ
jgi:hypothetical protein